MKEKYNIDIVTDEMDSRTQAYDKLFAEYNAGDSTYDAAMMRTAEVAKLASGGCLRDLNEMPHLDLTKDYWDQRANADLSIGGRMYYTTGDIGVVDNMCTHCMLFNKEMVRQYGFDDPYELVKDDKWTLETLGTMVRAVGEDANQDGVYDENDVYGLLTWLDNVQAILAGAGERVCKVNDNGEVEIEGAVRRGVPKETAELLFDQMYAFAQYAFNKSHAAAYAYVSYQTAYCKRYHPVEYLAAVLNNRITNIDDIKKYIAYGKENNIDFLPPDINKSGVSFTVENGKIRFALAAIKNIGSGSMEKIVEERKTHGDFVSLEDFLKRVESQYLNKRLVENLIKSGAFDCFKVSRAQMVSVFEPLMEMVYADKKKKESGQFSMFDLVENAAPAVVALPKSNIKEFPNKLKLSYEKEVLGLYVSGNPLDEYREKLKAFTFNTGMVTFSEDDDDFESSQKQSDWEGKEVSLAGVLEELKKIATRSGKTMAVGRLEDLHGSIELTFSPWYYEKIIKDKVEQDSVVTVTGKISFRQDKASLLVDKLEVWSEQKMAETDKNAVSEKLYLKMPFKDNELYAKLSAVLKEYAGDIPVILVIDGDRLGMAYKVRKNNGLIYELSDVLGEDNVRFVDVKPK